MLKYKKVKKRVVVIVCCGFDPKLGGVDEAKYVRTAL